MASQNLRRVIYQRYPIAPGVSGTMEFSANYEQRVKKRKVLLMGKSGSGKSSMRSIIFSNYVATDTRRLGATIDVEHSHVKFLGNLNLNLWDCGGQDAFMENYLASQRDHVFSNVAVLIYVFDIESREFDRDVITYSNCMRALKEYSSDARVFVLIHKMDLVQDTYRQKLFTERSNLITERSEGFKIDTYPTSIWDQSLYKAWAGIIYTLIPNVTKIEKLLQELLEHIDAEEIVLFERTTFLVVTSVTSKIGKMNPTKDRFERLSNIIKTFKQGVAKNTNQPRSSPQFEKMEIKTQKFSLFIQQLTTNTYALCVVPPGEKTLNMAKVNVEIARTNFEELDVMSRNYKNTKKPDDSLQDMLAGTEKLDIGSGDEGDKAEAKRAAKARKNARDRARKKAKAKAKGKGKALDEDSPEAGTTTEAETGTDELETEADTDADADAEADDADEFDAEAKV